ncbi:MAG: peptidoglycan-binding protein [Bryobacteraceae bacterium]|nr:peptidoglycan-binding protein [Bryobacteraceae bacterium]
MHAESRFASWYNFHVHLMGSWYTVLQGDCLSSIARRHGLTSWRRIYDAAENAAFRRRRPNPNVIEPGDVLFVPERELKDRQASTDKLHHYVARPDRTVLRILLADDDGHPYSECTYELAFGETRLFGSAADGVIEHVIEQRIDPLPESARLTVWWEQSPRRRCTWNLLIGHLDPVETVSGIQARLNNLGFDSGPVDGITGPITRGAVRAFQTKQDLVVDGIAGPVTKARLKQVYGC